MLKKIKKNAFSGESGNIFRGMVTLLVGAGLARIVGLASIPILTRLYSPEDYGVLAIYTSIVAVLVPILTLRYVTAIPLPKTDALAFNLFILCVKLILVGTVLISLVLSFFGETFLGWFSMQEFAHLWWLIAIGVMGTATYELFSIWATRKKDYKIIARTQFTQSLTGNAVKIGLGLLSLKPLGLVIGQLIAQSGGVGSLFKKSFQDFKQLYPKLSRKKQNFVAKYYKDFPWFRLPSQFLMVFSTQAPILMMSALYDKESTGQLGLAIMALSLPVSLIGGAISKAYYAEIAFIGRNDLKKIKRITLNVQKKLFVIGLPITIFIILLARPIFVFIFGKDWAVAGLYASILSPSMLFAFTSAPLVQVLNVIGSQKNYLFINLVRIICILLIFYVASFCNFESMLFLMCYSAFLSVFFIAVSVFIIRGLNAKRKAP